jgi:hypothetical protein
MSWSSRAPGLPVPKDHLDFDELSIGGFVLVCCRTDYIGHMSVVKWVGPTCLMKFGSGGGGGLCGGGQLACLRRVVVLLVRSR